MDVGQHTDAATIRELFQMSKKNWKIAIGNLYKYGFISIVTYPEERIWIRRDGNVDFYKVRSNSHKIKPAVAA